MASVKRQGNGRIFRNRRTVDGGKTQGLAFQSAQAMGARTHRAGPSRRGVWLLKSSMLTVLYSLNTLWDLC